MLELVQRKKMIVPLDGYNYFTRTKEERQHLGIASLLYAITYLCEVVKQVAIRLNMKNTSNSNPPASPCRRSHVGRSSSPPNKRVKKAGERHDGQLHPQTYRNCNYNYIYNNRADNSDRSPAKGGRRLDFSSRMIRRRPSKIVIPEAYVAWAGFGEAAEDGSPVVFEGDGYCLACKIGKKKVMEDGYGVMININGDPMQAYFAVFDGHGGKAAVDFATEMLGKNILFELKKSNYPVQMAIRAAYLTTDQEFLTKKVGSGTCVATVLVKDGKVHAANVGDCRVVMSRSGSAQTLTIDHRPEIVEERDRILNSGGYVCCHNGVWRVQGSLSISRAIGDLHMKDWIISEPETNTHRLTPDCEFLIIASDGLWDKVTDQEAVDVVLKHGINGVDPCKVLVDISCERGCKDDITVMVVDLRRFSRNRK